MVAIAVTDKIRDVLEAGGVAKEMEKSAEVETVSHGTLTRALDATGGQVSLRAMLHGVELHLTHAGAVAARRGAKRRNAAVERRVAALRARAGDLEYARMVRDVGRGVGLGGAERETMGGMGRLGAQMSVGVNVVVSMATCFTAGYFLGKHGSGSQTVGLVGGVFGMIVAMGVETVLVMTRLYSIDKDAEYRQRRRRRREKSEGRSRVVD